MIFSFGFIFSFLATTVAIIVGFLYILLPRFISFFIDSKFTHHIGIFVVTLQLNGGFRLRYFCERVLCIDIIQPQITIRKLPHRRAEQKQSVLSTPGSGDKKFDSYKWLIQSFGAIVAVRVEQFSMVFQENESCINLDHMSVSVLLSHEHENVFLITLHIESPRVFIAHRDKKIFLAAVKRATVENEVDLFSFNNHLPDKLCIFIDSPTIETSIDNIADMRKVIHDFRIGRQTTSTVSSKSWQKKMRQLPSRIFVSISSTRVVVREHSRSNLDRMISHASIPIDEQHVQLHCAVISCKCVLRCLAEIGEVIDVLFGVQKLDISLRAKHTEFQIFSANAVIESILSLLEKDVTSLAPNDIRVYLDECRLMFSSSEKILTFFTSARTNLITTSSQSSTKLPQIDAALTEDVEKKIPLACCSIVLTNCCVGIEADDESIELHCALSHLRHNPFVSAEKHERIAISLGDIRVIHVAETCSDIMTLFSAQAFASISITKKINVLMNIEMFILTINVPLTLLDFITTIKTRLLPLRSSDDVICATNHTHIQHTSSMLIQVHISVYEGDVCVSLIDRTQELYRYTCFRFEYLKCELLPTPNSCQYEFTNARVQCNTMRDVIQRDERQHLLCANANNGIVLPTLKISLTSSVILVHCNTINIDISLVFATSLCVMYMKFSAFKKQFESLPTHTTIHHTKDNNVRPIEFNAVTCVMNLHVNASNNVSAEFNTLSITSSRGFMALQGKFELNDHVDKQILHHQNLCVLTFNTFSVLRNSEKKSLIISLNTLRVEMAENFEFGNFYELFLYKWKAFQWFRTVDADRRKKFAVHPDKPRLPIGFDYTLFEIRIATLLLFFHEEYTERLYLVRRWIVLNSSQRHKHRRLAQLYQAETSDNWCLEHREKRLNNHTSRDSIVDDESSTPLEKLQSLHRSLRNSVSIEVDQFVLRLHSPSSVEEALRCVKARDSCPPESSPIQNDLCVFSNLWQMEVLIEVSKLLVLLRDYPFPLARATSSIIITGSLAQARLRAPKLFQKTRIVALPISWDGIRNIHTFVELSPYSSVATKYYIDIHLQGDALEINYGACQRGGITALSRAFSRLSSSRDVAVRNGFEESLDISTSSYGHSMQAGTPLVYWDMLRAIIHGNIRVNVLQMLFRVLSSASPYLSSFVEIRARKLALASTTRRVVVSANNLQIRLNDDSSSNDALHRPGLIFYSPNFRAIIRYQWASAHPTEDDALQHHVQHVHWQEADFKFSSPYRRDVFDVFRATKLSLACRVEIGPLKLVHHARLSTKTQESGSEKLPSRPVLSLWLNNIEWLTSVSRLFSKPPSSLRIRSKRAMRRSHKWRTPIPLSQSIGYLLRTIALKISCNHPVIEVLSERISEGIILGAQGKAKTLQFSSVLCVEDGAIENTSVWSWRRTRMSCQDFAVDLLVPSNFATTLADPEAEITSDRKTTESIPGSPFSSHSLAGPSQALFFVSATDLLYASPSAGGKSVDSSDKSPSVSESRSRSPCRPVLSASSHTISPNARLLSPSTALVVANEEFLWAQLGDNSTDSNTTATSHDKISLANVSSDHGAEMLVGKATTSPPSSPLLSTSRIPFARFSRSRSPDRFHEVHELGHEHYIRVCAVKLLWNNAIRIAFDAWWKFMAEFHHANASDSGSDNTVSHSHSSCDTNNDENVDDDNDTSSTHHSSIENDVVLPSLLQRSASTDLIRAFVDNEDSERNISASSRRSVKETDEINHEMFKQEQRKVHSLFLMQLEQPQINFQSTEVFSSVLVAAPDASVELSGFPFFLDDNEKICKSDVIDSESRAQRLREHCSTASYFSSTTEKHECSEFLYHKKRFDTRFNDAQLHVMLTDIDVDRNAMHWLPLHCFPQRKQTMDNVNDDDNDDDDDSVFKSQGVFQRITAPSTIKFEYVYDVNMDTVDERAFAFQRENCSTRASELCESAETKPRGSVDDTINQNFMCMRKHKDRYRFIRNALTSLTRLRIASIQMRMDSVQFGAVIDVVNFLVLAPVQEGWALAAACAREPVKISETKLLKSLDKALQMDAENKDQIVDTTVVRAIEYFVESGTCTMLTNSSEVHLRVRLQQLAGRHRYLLDGGRKLNIGLKQFDVFNMSDKALWPDVLTPHETWSVAKDTHQLMLLFRATIVGLPEQLPDLQNVTAWDHLEVNVFPLNIKALASHYTEIRNYFLPPIQETHPNDELMFSSSRFPRRKHGRSDTSRKRMSSSGSSEHRSSISSSQSRPSSVSVGDAESARPIPATQKTSSQALEYFKYVRLNELEFFVNYRGSYLDLDNLRVVIASFTCNHVLWDWNKFVSKLEQHVHRAVLGQTSSLLKQKFSRNVKSRGEKEHKIRDIFASTFNRMARAQQQYPMITASDDESFGEDERKRDIVCENRVLRARSVNDDDDDDDDDGEDDDDDDDGGGEDDDDGNDDDDSVTEQIVKPDSINS